MDLPPESAEVIKGLGWATFWSIIGRSIAHARAVQLGRRHVFSLALMWELPVAIGMAKVGQAAAEWAGLTSPNMRDGAVIAIAYIGPRIFETAFQWVSNLLNKTTSAP
jgi:hypothetical protein